ncbi:anaphase-promoting complex subunit 1 [Angomonas deanei]|uniref:Uncharacterized protein n=1 Tax=Angomonas deanei TaxID=59799 RepID=A0A7G2CGS7_9TRYP|nr:anaphase-promoting complex subunit 1 [Angomonas deanei]CAD2218084.1 hypothetical protein, conserved [Angomonas deanei]|eukprot:EPY21053.1 anaphase-promoting complex subunit 1 [Angomonas deanei]
MSAKSSVYTIDVGGCKENNYRDISLKQFGLTCFSVTHRGVLWAFLSYFPHDGTANATKLNNDEAHLDPLCLYSDEHEKKAEAWRPAGQKEYLCVFHREELHDMCGRYTVTYPHTVCTCYSVPDGTPSQFVLHNVQPLSVSAGVGGIFVYGRRQTPRHFSAPTIENEGEVYQAVSDLWYMASPLSLSPVYVPVHLNTSHFCNPFESEENGFSPMFSQVGKDHLSFPPPASPITKSVRLNAVVLYQFSHYTQNDRSDTRLFTVARTGDEEIGIALTTPVPAHKTMTWTWFPSRLSIPGLSYNKNLLHIVSSDYEMVTRQILFLHDTKSAKVHVLRTFDLVNGGGELELCFTLNCNGFPTVLPCFRNGCPQPVAISNHPAPNDVTFYGPYMLETNPSPDNVLVTLKNVPRNHSFQTRRVDLDDEGGAYGEGSKDGTTSGEGGNGLDNFAPPEMISGVQYQDGCVVVFLSYSSAANLTKEKQRGGREDGDNFVGRQKCEVTIEQLVEFPSLNPGGNLLLLHVLQTLEASLGWEKVRELELELFRRTCETWKLAGPAPTAEKSAGDPLLTLLVEVVHASIPEAGAPNERSSIEEDDGESDTEATLALLYDPLRITAATVQSLACGTRNTAATPRRAEDRSLYSKWSPGCCHTCLLSLHLLYESYKTQEQLWVYQPPLATAIFKMAVTMGVKGFATHYSLLVPYSLGERIPTLRGGATSPGQEEMGRYAIHGKLLSAVNQFHPTVTRSSDGILETLLSGGASPPNYFLCIRDLLYNVCQPTILYPMLNGLPDTHPIHVANRLYCLYASCLHASGKVEGEWWERIVENLHLYNLHDTRLLRRLSLGVSFPILQALSYGKTNPDSEWDQKLYAVVGRLDCVTDKRILKSLSQPGQNIVRAAEVNSTTHEYYQNLTEDDGVIMRPDFPKTWTDTRLDGAQVLFNTSVPLFLPGQGDGSDALYNTLAQLSKRARALPIGRGMLTMCTQNFKVRDNIPIPELVLDGRTGDGVTVKNSAEDVHPDKLLWPVFHNGCAAGFRFFPNESSRFSDGGEDGMNVTRHWIVHQIQSRDAHSPAARAGLLLAAGVLGHLKTFQLTDIYTLLVSPQPQYSWREVTTISVMLGLACSFRGSNNDLVFNCLSMHIQSLTPSVEEIEVSLDVQTSALVAIGLLCQRTLTNGFLIEMLLIEMSRLPSDEHCVNREGYVLGAGFSLGLLLLGMGNTHGSASRVEDRLLSFMEGSKRQPVPSALEGLENYKQFHGHDSGHFFTRALLNQGVQELSKCACTRVNEGGHYNVHISGPAAVMALGLMYLKTNNASIARRIMPTDGVASLQEVTPTMCLLRSMMSCLVNWAAIEANGQWLQANTPSTVIQLIATDAIKNLGLAQQQLHYIMMNVGHCIAGSVMALGLHYAGSLDADARRLILAELNGFLKGQIGSTGIVMSVFQKSSNAYEMCISACCTAIALVMAGSGDLQIFSIMRKLFTRTSGTTYGCQQAVSMSMGLLFLGGGRLTLSNSSDAIAALLMAFYPVWPEHPEDNVCHLQALRHLYALAVVPRVLETVDAVTHRPVSVPVQIVLRKGRSYRRRARFTREMRCGPPYRAAKRSSR